MTEPYVKQIHPFDATEVDRLALQKACDKCIFGYKAEEILAGAVDFTTQIWRGESAAGVFIMTTQIYQHPNGRELQVWHIGGDGFAENVDEALRVLKDFAQKEGCRWITGLGIRTAFNKIFKSHGFNDLYQNWILEIADVSQSTKH